MKTETAFWDSSALVPICVPEAASQFVGLQVRQYAPVVWWGSSVEVSSAIARLHRARELTDEQRQGAQLRLRMLKSGWREILPGDELKEIAEGMPGKHGLRAADSLQLAAALIWCGQRPAGRVFLCGDERLSNAAKAEGFSVEELPQVAP